jgi:serine phosphatase RsbU (regulator of sigma subunit)
MAQNNLDSLNQNSNPAKFDSLQLIIDGTGHDTTITRSKHIQVKLLSDIAEQHRQVDEICAHCLQQLKLELSTEEKEVYQYVYRYSLFFDGPNYKRQGNYGEASEVLHKALLFTETETDIGTFPEVLIALGNLYSEQDDNDQAMHHYELARIAAVKQGQRREEAASLINLGSATEDNDSLETDYYLRGIAICKEIGEITFQANALSNLGGLYGNNGDLDRALQCFLGALELNKQMKDPSKSIVTLFNIGFLHSLQNRPQEAIKHYLQSLALARRYDELLRVQRAADALYEIYEQIGDHKKALEMHVLYVASRDSIESASNKKAVAKQEIKYAYDKKAYQDSLTNAETKKVQDALLLASEAEGQQQEQLSYFLYGIAGIAMLLAAFIFNRFRLASKQKNIIEAQKQQVDNAFERLEEKNREVTDSIMYAKRIQGATLPADSFLARWQESMFVLYKPKDIVAGDFYWLEIVNKQILFAAADCTGHGVPGAMVSVLCNNALNRAVREYNLTDPGLILDKTREIITGGFERSDEDVKDGMDIAICALATYEDDQKNVRSVLKYAGAHNPLWIVRNGEVIETKADKQPIGKFERETPFTTHTFELEPNDTFYIFSDGYVDQFGGEKGKKLKAKAFREILVSIQEMSMEDQKIFLDQKFEEWRGGLEQVDDICVIGVRV